MAARVAAPWLRFGARGSRGAGSGLAGRFCCFLPWVLGFGAIASQQLYLFGVPEEGMKHRGAR